MSSSHAPRCIFRQKRCFFIYKNRKSTTCFFIHFLFRHIKSQPPYRKRSSRPRLSSGRVKPNWTGLCMPTHQSRGIRNRPSTSVSPSAMSFCVVLAAFNFSRSFSFFSFHPWKKNSNSITMWSDPGYGSGRGLTDPVRITKVAREGQNRETVSSKPTGLHCDCKQIWKKGLTNPKGRRSWGNFLLFWGITIRNRLGTRKKKTNSDGKFWKLDSAEEMGQWRIWEIVEREGKTSACRLKRWFDIKPVRDAVFLKIRASCVNFSVAKSINLFLKKN